MKEERRFPGRKVSKKEGGVQGRKEVSVRKEGREEG